MSEEYTLEKLVEDREPVALPTWIYVAVFTLPALFTFLFMGYYVEADMLLTGVTSLAVMNGSINSVIAWLTIRLDGQSAEALDHLDTIMSEMDKLESTLDEANTMVATFTDDLDEARRLFRKVGVSLDELDLEPVAEVVEKLKENKDGLNDILDNLRGVDIEDYINQAKRIEWKELLNSAEEIMTFVKGGGGKPMKIPEPTVTMPKLPDLSLLEPTVDEFFNDLDEDEDDWEDFDDDEEFFDEPPKPKSLKMTRGKKPSRNLKMKR